MNARQARATLDQYERVKAVIVEVIADEFDSYKKRTKAGPVTDMDTQHNEKVETIVSGCFSAFCGGLDMIELDRIHEAMYPQDAS